MRHFTQLQTILGHCRWIVVQPEPRRTYMNGLLGRLGVVGVPFGKGQKNNGKEETGLVQAPSVLRCTGFIQELQSLGTDVQDFGNVYYSSKTDVTSENMVNYGDFVSCAEQVSVQVSKVLADRRMCLVLGGDHSVAVGSVNSHMCRAGPHDVAVLWVDAHTDINVASTSTSGNIHGMSVALLAKELTGYWPQDRKGLDWLRPCMSLQNIAYIGLRSVDPWEAYFLQKFQIPAYSMEEVEKFGIHSVIDMALKQIDPCSSKSIHLSFDIDSLDYFEAPCTTVPVRGGLSLRQGIDIAESVFRTRRLAVMDLVEVSPCLGNDFQRQCTLDAAKHIILASFGHSRKGNPPCL